MTMTLTPITRSIGFETEARLFIRDAIKAQLVTPDTGIWLIPMGFYVESDILKINRLDYKEQIENDLNEIANPMKWVVNVKSIVMKPSPGTVRYDYMCYLTSTSVMLDDELIDVIRYC